MRKLTLKVRILPTSFMQVHLRPKKFLLGSSLAFTLKEGPARCAKVCNKSWVILRDSAAILTQTAVELRNAIHSI